MNENKTCTCPVCNREVIPIDGLTGDEQIINGIIEFYKDMQDKKNYPHCPRCGQERMTDRNAISRQFNIDVCPTCGADEALRAKNGNVLPAEEWWIIKEVYKFKEYRKTKSE